LNRQERKDRKATHPPFQTQRRKDAKAQRREGAKVHPPTKKRRDAEEYCWHVPIWRDFRPSDGRKPLGLEFAAKKGFRIGFQTQQLALEMRKSRQFTSSLKTWEDAPPPELEKGR
jgi:hypothetical protein